MLSEEGTLSSAASALSPPRGGSCLGAVSAVEAGGAEGTCTRRVSPGACGRLGDGAPAGAAHTGAPCRGKPLPPRREGVPHAGGSVVLPLPAFIRLLRIRLLLQEES